MPLRAGPRHCGQSEVEVPLSADLVTDATARHKPSIASVASILDFIIHSFGLLELLSDFLSLRGYAEFYKMFQHLAAKPRRRLRSHLHIQHILLGEGKGWSEIRFA